MKENRKLILIIGFPRSGTKLLRVILNNHSHIFITHELLFLPILLRNWSDYGDLSDFANFERMYKEILKTDYFFRKETSGADVISAKEWYGLCETYDPFGVFTALVRYETGAPTGSDVWLGDKSPNYTTHLSEIKKGVPEAKIVHIVRDVRDAALSARKLWGKNIYRFAQRWADGMRGLRASLDLLSNREFIEVRYEDLITNPGQTVFDILDFLQLDYQPDLLSLIKSPENLGDTRGVSAVVNSNYGKYKDQLSKRQITRLESLVWDVLEKYNYEVGDYSTVRRTPARLMAWYTVCDVINRLRFDLKLHRNLFTAIRSFITRVRTPL